MAQYTQGRWNGKQTSGAGNENLTYADSRYSPTAGSNYLWKDAPILANLCDRRIAYWDHNDFAQANEFDATNDWTKTVVGTTPTAAIATAVHYKGGFLKMDTVTTVDFDSVQVQRKDLPYLVASGKDIWWETPIFLEGTIEPGFAIGLMLADTTILASAAPTVTSGIYFKKLKDSASIYAENISTTATTSAAVGTIVVGTQMFLGFHVVSNTRIDYYINNVLVAQHTTNIPSVALAVSYALANTDTGTPTANNVIYTDYYTGLQVR